MTSTSSSASTGDCAVCFKPAKLRCSGCQRCEVEVHFCGQEHQKLVWPTHKKVCGAVDPRVCKPFVAPPLSKTEAYEAKRDLHKIANPLQAGFAGLSGGTRNLWDGLRTGGVREEQGVLDNLSRPLIEWRAFPGVFIYYNQLLRTIRYYRVQNSFGKPLLEPFSLLAGFQVGFMTDAQIKGKIFEPSQERYWIELSHRALCFFAAMEKKASEVGTGSLFQKQLDGEAERWTRSLLSYMRRKKPEMVEHAEYAASSA